MYHKNWIWLLIPLLVGKIVELYISIIKRVCINKDQISKISYNTIFNLITTSNIFIKFSINVWKILNINAWLPMFLDKLISSKINRIMDFINKEQNNNKTLRN
jgi:hypothetical protein